MQKTSCSNPRSIFLRIHQPLGGAGGQAADIEIQVQGGGWRFIRIQRFKKAWLLLRKLTCPLNKDHFKRTCHFPTIIFEGAMLVFGGCNPKSICLGGLDMVEHLPKNTLRLKILWQLVPATCAEAKEILFLREILNTQLASDM